MLLNLNLSVLLVELVTGLFCWVLGVTSGLAHDANISSHAGAVTGGEQGLDR
jgi:hypothetical protein